MYENLVAKTKLAINADPFYCFLPVHICVPRVYVLHDHKYMFDISDAIIHKKNMSGVNGRFSNDLMWVGIAGLIGLLVAFAISLTVCIRNKWFWLNALISFLAVFFLHRFIIQFSLGYYIGYLFFHLPVWIRLSGTGCIILFAGCYLLLSTCVSKFIEKDRFAFHTKPQ